METIYFSLYNDSKFKRNVDNYETMIPSSSSSQPPPFSAFRPSITRGGPQPPSSRNHRPDPSSNSTALRNSLCDSESDLDECRNPGSGTSISYSRILASRNHPLYNKTTPPLTSRSQSRRYSSRYLKNTKRFRRENSTGMMTFLTSLLLSTAIIISISYKSISAATPGHHQHDPNILAVFRDSHEDHEVELERMVMDHSTNRLYIGGVNHLYDLSSEGLSIREHAITGPRPDSILCADALTLCKEPLYPTNSYTKALAIYPNSNKLIECTSLYQGRCRTRNLSNIRRESEVRSSRPGVVANDQPSSTEIFVGTGPSPTAQLSGFQDDGGSSSSPVVLYVASTYLPLSVGPRDALDVPAVSSLSLDSDRLFEFTSQSISSGTYMKLDLRKVPQLRIDYVGGFESNGFAYFATRQPNYNPSAEIHPIISKLIRVCTQDSNFYSYTEIELECAANGLNYNLLQAIHVSHPGFDLSAALKINPTDLVVFGVFSRGEGVERNMTSRNSALCVYPLRNIEEKFFENIRMCYNGHMRTNLPWFNSDKMCTATRYNDHEILCGKDVNSHINGELPISATAFLVDKTSTFTSIIVSSVLTATIAFVGTANGMVHKVLVGGNGESRIIKSMQLTPDETPILRDMALDDKNGLLYAMSKFAVYKINVKLCSHSQDCHSCLMTSDPYCGWCMKTSACTTQEVCDADIINPKADWLNYKSGRCPYIKSVEPSEQQITKAQALRIYIDNAPPSLTTGAFSEIYCSFHFPNQQVVNVTAISREDNTIICMTPTRSSIKDFLPKKRVKSGTAHHIVVSLAVVKAFDGSILASSNFSFFDCYQLKTCIDCTRSKFSCDWCTLSSKCVPNSEDACQGEQLVNSIGRPSASSRLGPEFCPRFTASESHIYVASGTKQRISVRVHNLQNQMGAFKCQYTLEAEKKVHEKLATREGDEIICDDMLFEFSGLGGSTSLNETGAAHARFDIVWALITANGRPTFHPLDNADNLHVVIYKCAQLTQNCGECLSLDTHKYDCGWCEDEARCLPKNSCPNWLKRSSRMAICPNPRIDNFTPKKGPINGGTKITITGLNLGLSYTDVRDAVRVASAKCDVSEHEYVSPTKIVCYTRTPSTRQRQGQHIVIRLKDEEKYTAASAQTFTYTNPTIESFQPHRGPISGGTDLTITGADLDSGFNFSIKIGNSPCQIKQRTSSMVVCRTEPVQMERSDYVVLIADGTQIKADKDLFQYAAKPYIERIPKPVSIISGGISLDLHGNGFDLLQRPKMVVTYEDQVYTGGNCDVISEHLMICPTPSFEDLYRVSPSIEKPLKLDYGFDFDDTLTGNLTLERGFSKLFVYPDPKLLPISEKPIVRGGSDLVIKGTNLNLAASSRDIRVLVGNKRCNVSALSATTLTCILPSHIDDNEPDPMEVVAAIGNKAEKVGEVIRNPKLQDGSIWLILTIAVACIGVFLALLLFILYRRKSTSHNRELRYLKAQMNSIEIRVAQECKEAFHELQTNMNALAGSMPQGSFIPFRSYTDYVARVLFPHATSNPALNDLVIEQDRAKSVESGLRQFHQLLQNRTFLLSFVRTIDENKYLLMKDRVYVGSLLSYVLAERMEYFTEILKQLLRDLIRKNVEGKFQPKILFRRAESVAERMLSAWFSFLMYKFVRKCAGKQLYQLYWATKQQTEKGPQDAITMDARYSLSEEKLLRASFDFHELTVIVVIENGTSSSSPIYDLQVRVLDCDTITQVKERIFEARYKGTPFSERPTPNDFVLELRTPTHRMLLQDLDSSSRCENGFWRQNTLAHYKLENKAILALIPKQPASSYNLSLTSDKSDKSSSSFSFPHQQRAINSPPLGQPFIHQNGNGIIVFGTQTMSSLNNLRGDTHKDSNSASRFYHLIKPNGEHRTQGGQEKMVTEIYLTRLLTMKGTLQKFIEDLFKVIFTTTNGVCAFPPCIKYMFDCLDEMSREYSTMDPEIVHTWKSNALPLRFWVNLIKNPDFIFDIQRPTKIEGSLNVVAQTLMDACSTQEHHFTKDSPSSKLLFANEIDKYKLLVQRFYADIQAMPIINDRDMGMLLTEESREHAQELVYFSALNELYAYANQNKEMVIDELNQNEFALQQQLAEKFQKMLDTMEQPPDVLATISNSSLENFDKQQQRSMSGQRGQVLPHPHHYERRIY